MKKRVIPITLLDGIDVGHPKWRLCWCGLNQSVHEEMEDISFKDLQCKCGYFLMSLTALQSHITPLVLASDKLLPASQAKGTKSTSFLA